MGGCIAVPGNNQGVTDKQCHDNCYVNPVSWWPCNVGGQISNGVGSNNLCICTDGSNPTAAPTQSPTPAPTSSPTPSPTQGPTNPPGPTPTPGPNPVVPADQRSQKSASDTACTNIN